MNNRKRFNMINDLAVSIMENDDLTFIFKQARNIYDLTVHKEKTKEENKMKTNNMSFVVSDDNAEFVIELNEYTGVIGVMIAEDDYIAHSEVVPLLETNNVYFNDIIEQQGYAISKFRVFVEQAKALAFNWLNHDTARLVSHGLTIEFEHYRNNTPDKLTFMVGSNSVTIHQKDVVNTLETLGKFLDRLETELYIIKGGME